jgi:hypothetical protein
MMSSWNNLVSIRHGAWPEQDSYRMTCNLEAIIFVSKLSGFQGFVCQDHYPLNPLYPLTALSLLKCELNTISGKHARQDDNGGIAAIDAGS